MDCPVKWDYINKMKVLRFSCITSSILLLFIAVLAPQPASAQSDEFVTVHRTETEDGGYIFYADNSNIIPMYLSFDFESLNGLNADVDLPVGILLPPGSKDIEIVRLSRNGENRVSFRSSALSVRGDPYNARHDDSHAYLFPFAHGTKHQVTQGENGSFTHMGENSYAIDFDLDAGQEIYAARAGLVVEVKEDSRSGGPAARYSSQGNYILIYHEDGTFGNYVHLQYNGALVAVGEEVAAGQLIGLSGNTGRSSGPHLHFDVRIPKPDGTMQSIPISFLDHEGKAIRLEEGRWYYANHPGGEKFPVVFGDDLENSDYSGYLEIIPSGPLTVRTEKIDSTIVAFLQNGSDSRLAIETTLQLKGMSASTPMNIELEVAPKTEVFLTILRPLPGVRQAQYGYQLRYRELD